MLSFDEASSLPRILHTLGSDPADVDEDDAEVSTTPGPGAGTGARIGREPVCVTHPQWRLGSVPACGKCTGGLVRLGGFHPVEAVSHAPDII